MQILQSNKDFSEEKNARLEQLRVALGMSQHDFANKIGINKSTVSLIESNKRNLSTKTAYLITGKIANVNIRWLLKGEGEMFLPDKQLAPVHTAETYPIPDLDTMTDPEEKAAWERVRELEKENKELLETVMRLVRIMEEKNSNKDVQ